MRIQTRGFTLVELLVVVLVIAIIAAVGVPTYQDYMYQAKTAEAYQAVRSMSDRQRTYFLENKSFMTAQLNPGPTRNYGYGDNWMKIYSPTENMGWDKIGLPFPAGQSTIFRYAAQAGIGSNQVQADGNSYAVSANLSSGVQAIFGYSSGHSETFCLSTPALATTGTIATPATFGIDNSGQPDDYKWVIVGAQGYLKYGSRTCRYVLMVIEASSATKNIPTTRGGLLQFDHFFSMVGDDVPIDSGLEEEGEGLDEGEGGLDEP